MVCVYFGCLCQARTDDPALRGNSYVGTDLSSQAVTHQVFSARMSLTSVFGMGTGGPSSLLVPTEKCVFLNARKIIPHKVPFVKHFFDFFAEICKNTLKSHSLTLSHQIIVGNYKP